MKIKTLVAALALSMFASAASSLEFRIGISGAWTDFDATGTETVKSSSATNTTDDVGDSVFIPTGLIEVGTDGGWTVGIDYVDAEQIGAESSTRPDTDVDDSSDTSGTNSASADLDKHITYYISKTLGENLYVKAGFSQADVLTTENLATGTTYGDVTVDGKMFAVGMQGRSSNNWMLRLEYAITDYDDITITGSADADSVSNKVDAELDSKAFKIQIVKAF